MSVAARISLLACVSATLLAGCGSSEEPTIPSQNATEMLNALEGIRSSIAAGSCDIALEQADDFKRDVVLLPAPVDDTVKQGLFEVADRLPELIEQQPGCGPSTTGASGVLESADQTSGGPTTSPTTTTTTTTTDPTTTTETTQPEPDGGTEPTPAEPPAPAPQGDDGAGSTGGPTSGGIEGEKGVSR